MFYLNGSWFKAICGAVAALLYFGFAISMVKNLITSFPLVKKLTSESAASSPNTKNVILTLGSKTGENCVSAISMVICFNLLCDAPFNTNAYKVMELWVVVLLVTRIFFVTFEKYTAASIATKFCYDLVTVAGMALLVLFSKYPAIELAVYSLKGIAIDFGQCLVGLILPILYFIIATVGIKMMHDATFTPHLHNYELRSSSRTILICSVLLGVGSIIVYITGGYSSKLDFEGIIYMFKPYLSYIFLSTSILITSYLPTEYNKHVGEGVNADKCEVNEKGELHIFDYVTEIQAFAFEYRTDIKKIYIPASVSVIHDKAFYGCSGVTEIHCDHYAAGVGWSPAWMDGCDGTLFWKTIDSDYPTTPTQPAAPVKPAAPEAIPYATPVASVAYAAPAAPVNYVAQPGYGAPVQPNNYSAPAQQSYAAPGYAAPTEPTYAAPGYVAPAPNYSAPANYGAQPGYNAPVQPNNYGAPAQPSYAAPGYAVPTEPTYAAPGYAAPVDPAYVAPAEPMPYVAPDNNFVDNA